MSGGQNIRRTESKRSETNTLSAILRNAFDGKDLRILAKNDPLVASNPHLSLECHITIHELRKQLLETKVHSGFSNQFQWIFSRRSKLLPEGGTMPNLDPIPVKLQAAIAQARTGGTIRRDDPAREEWSRIYYDLNSRRYSGALVAVLSRSETQTLRLSLIYALLDSFSPDPGRAPSSDSRHLGLLRSQLSTDLRRLNRRFVYGQRAWRDQGLPRRKSVEAPRGDRETYTGRRVC